MLLEDHCPLEQLQLSQILVQVSCSAHTWLTATKHMARIQECKHNKKTFATDLPTFYIGQ